MATSVRSTANFISYDLRPAKQSERRILLEVLKVAADAGLAIRDYRYVGMGANRFYDFLLVHKYLGLARMVSLEHDPVMFKRAAFNCPYGFISVQPKTAAEFIAADDFAVPTVLWLDYDGGLGPRLVEDISSLGTKLKLGDFCFVTAYGGPPRVLEKKNMQERLEWFQENLGEVAGALTLDDLQNANFPGAVHKCLVAAFRNAFAFHPQGRFVLVLQVEYSDSKTMVTVGGGLLTDELADRLKVRIGSALPFLAVDAAKLYEIRSFHLTERERSLFDRASTRPRRSKERNQLKALGFIDSDFKDYGDLIRYLPRYVETMV